MLCQGFPMFGVSWRGGGFPQPLDNQKLMKGRIASKLNDYVGVGLTCVQITTSPKQTNAVKAHSIMYSCMQEHRVSGFTQHNSRVGTELLES